MSPLLKGKGAKIISKNIKKLEHEGGRPHKQNIAIAMHKAGKKPKMAKKENMKKYFDKRMKQIHGGK